MCTTGTSVPKGKQDLGKLWITYVVIDHVCPWARPNPGQSKTPEPHTLKMLVLQYKMLDLLISSFPLNYLLMKTTAMEDYRKHVNILLDLD